MCAPKPKESEMSSTQERRETAIETPRARTVDMKLEIVVIPVADVDRAKHFYGGLGWRLDADFAAGDDFRVIQFTPPGSGCSVIFGRNVTAAAPGSARGLYLIASDIEAARDELGPVCEVKNCSRIFVEIDKSVGETFKISRCPAFHKPISVRCFRPQHNRGPKPTSKKSVRRALSGVVSENVRQDRQACQNAIPGQSSHAAARLWIQAGEHRQGYAIAAGLSWPPGHPIDCTLHGIGTGSVRRMAERVLISRL
jgi:catechol 2,3-dioxygenase-like lactoylglutathione lyase family enzyme